MADPLKAEYTPILKWPAETRPQEANAEFAAWKLWVGVNCTWLYIGSQDAWAVFIIYLFFRSSFPCTPTDVTSIACLFKKHTYQMLSCTASMAVSVWGLRAAPLSTTTHLGIFSSTDLIFWKWMSKKIWPCDFHRFSMLFACGVSTGLFFYGVAEPVFHYIGITFPSKLCRVFWMLNCQLGPNRFTADPSLPDNRLAQEAINITLYHW